MQELPTTGLTKAIGVSNMSIKKLLHLLSYAKIVPAINQACPCTSGQPLQSLCGPLRLQLL